jgi:hypothetical protein
MNKDIQAQLVIRDIGISNAARRKELIAWLRNQAEHLEKDECDGKQYTAKFYYSSKG